MDPFTSALFIFKKFSTFLSSIPTKVWLAIVVLLTILGIYWYIGNLQDTIKSRDNTIVSLQSENKTLLTERDSLRSAINVQNLAVDNLHKLGENLRQKIYVAQKDFQNKIDAYNTYIDSLRGEVVPTDCREAVVWHSQKMKEFESKYLLGTSK